MSDEEYGEYPRFESPTDSTISLVGSVTGRDYLSHYTERTSGIDRSDSEESDRPPWDTLALRGCGCCDSDNESKSTVHDFLRFDKLSLGRRWDDDDRRAKERRSQERFNRRDDDDRRAKVRRSREGFNRQDDDDRRAKVRRSRERFNRQDDDDRRAKHTRSQERFNRRDDDDRRAKVMRSRERFNRQDDDDRRAKDRRLQERFNRQDDDDRRSKDRRSQERFNHRGDDDRRAKDMRSRERFNHRGDDVRRAIDRLSQEKLYRRDDDDTRAQYGSSSGSDESDREHESFYQEDLSASSATALVVAAVDFGTTYSGWAFSFRHDFERDPLKISAKQWIGGQLVSMKGPTCVLIHPDGKSLVAFGYEAENQYADLMSEKKHNQYYFFRRFKMMLHGKVGMERDVKLQDMTGKELPAQKVFSLAIKYLVDDLKNMCAKQIAEKSFTQKDIRWVLTVPAIWNDVAKQFMREAAEKAGISRNQLSIALEPEAASVYCRHIPVERKDEFSLSNFKAGTKYLVLDAGGGTVDVTVHEIKRDGNLKELHKASGDAWGGTMVDDAFEAFLAQIFGDKVMEVFKRQHLEDHFDILRDFEIKKRSLNLKQEGRITLRFPASLRELVKKERGMEANALVAKSGFKDKITMVQDKLRIDADLLVRLFDKPVRSIIEHVASLLRKPEVKGCKAIVMVGGFSESPVLQEKVRETFQSMNIRTIVPQDAGLAVLKGAVIYGHMPEAIAERVCRYTYGTAQYDDTFDIHARVGQSIKIGEETAEIIRSPVSPTQLTVGFPIFSSTSKNPRKSTEHGCRQIGMIVVPNPDPRPYAADENRLLGVTFLFGGTEIEVKVVAKKTGREDRTYIDFLQ